VELRVRHGLARVEVREGRRDPVAAAREQDRLDLGIEEEIPIPRSALGRGPREAEERLARGDDIGAESSLVKLFWANVSQRLAETAVAALGPEALLTPGRWASRLLSTRANSIMGGTSEIQRNVIGERLLGLPREGR